MLVDVDDGDEEYSSAHKDWKLLGLLLSVHSCFCCCTWLCITGHFDDPPLCSSIVDDDELVVADK